MNGISRFITKHKDENLTIYFEPVPELEGIRIVMRRNTAIVARVVTYFDLSYTNTKVPRMIQMLDDMYSQFSVFKEDK